MIRYYLKSAFRNFQRQPLSTLISVSGITLGITCVIVIMLFVQFEFSYDKFHENIEDIYEIHAEVHWGPEPWIQNNLQAALVPEMQKRFPEIKSISRYEEMNDIVVEINHEPFYDDGFAAVDSQFFDIFTCPILSGSTDAFIQDPHSIMLSEEMANKYFGSSDPVGKSIKMNDDLMTISGVFANVPRNSTLRYNFLVPFGFLKEFRNNPNMDNDWDNWYLRSFLVLEKNTNVEAFKSKIVGLYQEHDDIDPENKVLIHPFKEMHLRPLRINYTGLDLLGYIRITAFVALMVLIIACINFMSLSTATFATRSKEVGIKKTLGSKRRFLINQFMLESIILAFAGGILSLLVVPVILPSFNQLLDTELNYNINNLEFFAFFILIVLFTGILAGSYPSFFLSSFQPVKTLKGKMLTNTGKNVLRKGLVVFQFTLSILFIIGMLVTYKQLKYMLNKDVGFNKEHVIFADLNDDSDYELLKEELLKNPYVENVSAAAWWGFDNNANTSGYNYAGKPEDFDLLLTWQLVDFDYIETLEIPIVQGRGFSKEYPSDATNAYILNETAVREFELIEPVGSRFQLWGRWGTIIGVMKDAHFRDLGSPIDPRILRINEDDFGRVLIRLKQINRESSLITATNSVKKSWQKIYPHTPFEFTFLDDNYKSVYEDYQRIIKLFSAFSILSIFISCLGLFGLTLYTAEQKTKEIGIRKTNGARSTQVILLLIKEFVIYIIIAYAIIGPIAYILMQKWLDNFSYQTKMSWWIFALAGSIALVIALITVSWQSWRAASRNPVEALRYE